jgi:hypothetical protein
MMQNILLALSIILLAANLGVVVFNQLHQPKPVPRRAFHLPASASSTYIPAGQVACYSVVLHEGRLHAITTIAENPQGFWLLMKSADLNGDTLTIMDKQTPLYLVRTPLDLAFEFVTSLEG